MIAYLLANESKWKELEKIAAPVKGNTRKLGREKVEEAIIKLCEGKLISLNDLANLLEMKPDTLRKNYLNPLVASERLSLAYPTKRHHPKQAYWSGAVENKKD